MAKAISDFGMKPPIDEEHILAIERPDSSLWTYYLLCCVAAFPLLPLTLLPAWFKYHTLRYKFTSEGVSMQWGILFRRETLLNYARIQDIHLRSNVVERWLGLARILIQTASGSASAEMTIEGLKEYAAVRDFLYSRMRGVKDAAARGAGAKSSAMTEVGAQPELVEVLRLISAEVRQLRTEIEQTRTVPPPSSDV